MKNGLERSIIANIITTILAILLVHIVSTLLRKSFDPSANIAAFQLVGATISVMIISAITNRKVLCSKYEYVCALLISLVLIVFYVLSDMTLLLSMLAVPLVCPFAALTSNFIARQLPKWLDGSLKRHPVKSYLWLLIALLMIVQTARLSSWVVDSSTNWFISTDHPLFAQHMCMVAYIYAADLNRQDVDNIYDKTHYPGLNPDAHIHTTIKNLYPEDPYQYPPQFLLLPRLAIALTNDFDLIKIFWLFLQALFFGFIAITVARFVGGDIGFIAAMLIPILLISFPVLSNLQYGQFHMMSILMAVAAMMWFAQGKYSLGGAALAFAMISKLAPGILLIYLVASKRWKEVGWTLGFCAVFSLLAVAVVGTKPFIAFFNYQLPNLQNGSAFAFADVWPEYRDILIAGNQSPFAFIYKLGALGFPWTSLSVAKFTHLLYTISVIVLAFIAARFKGSNFKQLLVWMALLNLAVLISKGAWGDYTPIGTIWMMTFMVRVMISSKKMKLFIGTCWVFMFLSLGVLPLPGLTNPAVYIPLAAVGMILAITFNMWVIFQQKQFAEVIFRKE